MKNLRSSVFETNSSSSHSITYMSKTRGNNNSAMPMNNNNYNIVNDIDLPYRSIVKSEKEKARYLLGLFAGYISELGLDDNYNFKSGISNEEFKKDCEAILKLPAIKAYVAVIKDIYNTDVVLDFENQDNFPYFSEGVSDDNSTLSDIIDIDWKNEFEVFEFLRECITNPECLFSDCEEDW